MIVINLIIYCLENIKAKRADKLAAKANKKQVAAGHSGRLWIDKHGSLLYYSKNEHGVVIGLVETTLYNTKTYEPVQEVVALYIPNNTYNNEPE